MSKDDFINELKRIKGNPIYFLEKYYNAVNADNPLVLTDLDKESIYKQFKGVPLFKNPDDAFDFHEKIEKLKKKGLKDWEIY